MSLVCKFSVVSLNWNRKASLNRSIALGNQVRNQLKIQLLPITNILAHLWWVWLRDLPFPVAHWHGSIQDKKLIHSDRARSVYNLPKVFSGFLVLERHLQFHILLNWSTFSLLTNIWMHSLSAIPWSLF